MKLKLSNLIMCSLFFTIMADQNLFLGGIVKSTDEMLISGVEVILYSDTLIRDTTNENGEFLISANTDIKRKKSAENSCAKIQNISIKGKQLGFIVKSTVNNGSIRIFSINGKTRCKIKTGTLNPGIRKEMLPDLSAGFYIMYLNLDEVLVTGKLLSTGNHFFISKGFSEIENTTYLATGAQTQIDDTLIVRKENFDTVKKSISSYNQTNIEIIMKRSVKRPVYAYAAMEENTCADCDVPELPDAAHLSSNSKLPDPFVKIDGTRLSKRSEWRCRRQEIIRQAQKYIYGEKPVPDIVTGNVNEEKISVHVEDEGKEIGFSADIVLPSVGQKPFPAIINVGTKNPFFGGISLGEDRILEQGVAVIYYDHYEIGKEGTAEASRGKPNPGLFYDIYGGDHSAGLLMAWAWGASRIIDVFQQSEQDFIDWEKLGVTGCSRNGKGAFAIGLFDERIALTIPQETSTGGVPAYRIVDVLNTERTDHNYYGLNWLSNNFEPFVFKNGVSNAVKLPIDAHSLVAAIAPRGLLVLDNPHQPQMSAPAGYVSVKAGAEVYKAMGTEENISYHSDVSNTLHCSYKNEYTELLISNINKFLKHESEESGRTVVNSSGTLDISQWINWEAPVLEDDIQQ